MTAPLFTRPRFLPSCKINGGTIEHSLISDGCIINEARIRHSVIGLRSIVGQASMLDRVIMMGSDFYELPKATKDNIYQWSAGPWSWTQYDN